MVNVSRISLESSVLVLYHQALESMGCILPEQEIRTLDKEDSYLA